MEEGTWEKELILKSKFPTFSLKDKIVLDGRGSDKESHREGKEEENNPKSKQGVLFGIFILEGKKGDTWTKWRRA